jgi:hypothetical protein
MNDEPGVNENLLISLERRIFVFEDIDCMNPVEPVVPVEPLESRCPCWTSWFIAIMSCSL